MAVVIPTSQLTFSCRLLRQLLRREQDNIFVSPASVGLALGMVAAGAQGSTLAALEQTLGIDAKLAANRAERLFASLKTLPPGVTVELANSLWARSELTLSRRYVAAMRESYRGEVRSLDFKLASAPTIVNDWVSRATHGQINSLVDSIDNATVLLLINATYFHGRWASPFDGQQTIDHEFATASGSVTQVRMMQKSASFSYMDDSDVQAVRLPYKQGRFHLLVVLPRARLSTAAFDAIAQPESMARILASLREREGFLGLPRLRLGYTADLVPELAEMGMELALTEDADFSGIFDGNVGAFISRVLHKTRLEIDEQGTTAAAATLVEMSLGTSIMAPAPFEMIVDRPFLVALIESETDLPLFIGVIGDPTAR